VTPAGPRPRYVVLDPVPWHREDQDGFGCDVAQPIGGREHAPAVATSYGRTRGEAKRRAEVIARALNRPEATS
jgi:hypothetical protein